MIRNATLRILALCLALAPVSVAAEIRNLPVPATTILANETITAGMVVQRQFRVTATSTMGIATSRDQLTGKQARRRLVAGKPIPMSALQMPLAVKRGAGAPAVYATGGITISAYLVALQDGAAGDVITARNPETGIAVRVSVQPDGSLRVADP